MQNEKHAIRPVALIILDGWGHREESQHNAIFHAKIPHYDAMWKHYPHTTLLASEGGVGLPEGQIGNSEVGHMTIGAGTIIDTSLVRINKSAQEGKFLKNVVFQKIFAHVKNNDSTLHVLGLVSPGGIHSHSDHLNAFLEAAKESGVTKVAIHAFTDGRDTPPRSASKYLRELENELSRLGIGRIATVSGRFYAMDRDNNWERLKQFEDAAFHASAILKSSDRPSEVIEQQYKQGALDEHLKPIVFLDERGKTETIGGNDAVFLFNFRADRVRAFTKKALEYAEGKNMLIATMTEYHPKFAVEVAFPPFSIETTLSSEISKAGFSQVHIAETEKFPHATYFLNGGRNEPHVGEEHIMLQSRQDIPTHDMAPKMRAEGIADEAIKSVEKGTDFLFINFANVDMVGHTGNVPAIIEAAEEIDAQLERVFRAVTDAGGSCVISADHGNAEINVDSETGEVHTAHTLSPVPFIITKENLALRDTGTLADIAPTVLELMALPKPSSMTGVSLISGETPYVGHPTSKV
ncbi:MAG: 2,3-bisphosphoglycerate-independent phosphoglycerate mutase [bacterium]|nr:2,3-bisphosphoglycerate-independent phosphoglycerate mutase [bacterium]